MKFTIDRDLFTQLINQVSRVAKPNSAIPILSGIKLNITDNKLTLTTSDVDVSLVVTTDKIMNQEDGGVIADARILAQLIKSLQSKYITLAVDTNNQSYDFDNSFEINIIDGKNKLTMQGLDEQMYIRLADDDKTKQITLARNDLVDLIDHTVYAVSKDNSHIVLQGVKFTLKDHTMQAIATDTRMFAQYTIQSKLEYPEMSFVLSSNSLKLLKSMLTSKNVKMAKLDDQQGLSFTDEHVHLQVRELEGNYPKTSQLIPREEVLTQQFVLNRQNILVNLKPILAFNKLSKEPVFNLVLTSGNNVATLITTNNEIGGKANCEIQLNHPADRDFNIGLNPLLLNKMIQSIDSDTIKFDMQDSHLRPILIEPTNNANYIQLLTPIRTY